MNMTDPYQPLSDYLPHDLSQGPSGSVVPARVVAVFDGAVGLLLALKASSLPLPGNYFALVAIVFFLLAFGLVTTCRWAWFLGMCLHTLIMALGLCIYLFLLFASVLTWGEAWHGVTFGGSVVGLIVASIVFTLFEAIAYFPVALLRSESTQLAFFKQIVA